MSGREKRSKTLNEVVLPEIKHHVGPTVDPAKPLPTSLQSDFLPEDVLLVLANPPPPTTENLGPNPFVRNLETSEAPTRRPPNNLWNHNVRRTKFNHLTRTIPCICGAGRDISFLYDVPPKAVKPPKPKVADKSEIRAQESIEDSQQSSINLPDTLVPEEYHVVKNKGVLGLEYHEDRFTSHAQDHEKHLVVFPSLNPSSRYEVLQLKKTMAAMLEKIGVNDDNQIISGPTQLHNILDLIKKEQNIYNVIFHELIRQVSVECVERGELLAEIRDRYSNLLNRVPLQIKGLHEEVMAQRALDRRLTEELQRFRQTIGSLTDQLNTVRAHDEKVTVEAKDNQSQLKQALSESQKSASLVAEYHGLYELQRKRLEAQVNSLVHEKELWSSAAYSLALKVTEEHDLNTARRLHSSEKAWVTLAKHFTVLLSEKDTELLTRLQEHVELWRKQVEDFNKTLEAREAQMAETMRSVKANFASWHKDFKKTVFSKDGQLVKAPDKKKIGRLYNEMRAWEQLLRGYLDEMDKQSIADVTDTFGGETQLTGQGALFQMRQQNEWWTEVALKVFARHKSEDGVYPPDYDDMQKVNDEVDRLDKQYHIRISGENGVATTLINLSNELETWANKFQSIIHGSNPLPDQEWTRLHQLLGEWCNYMEKAIQFVGTTQREEDRAQRLYHKRADMANVLKLTNKWTSSVLNGMDSEDARLVEKVNFIHTAMIRWMVQILLRLAPDRETHSKEARETVLVGAISVSQLKENAVELFTQLDDFSRYVTICCDEIVMESVQALREQFVEEADNELRDLKRLKAECDLWIENAQLMIVQLTGEQVEWASSAVNEAQQLQQQRRDEKPDKTQTESTQEMSERDVTASMTSRGHTIMSADDTGRLDTPGDEIAALMDSVAGGETENIGQGTLSQLQQDMELTPSVRDDASVLEREQTALLGGEEQQDGVSAVPDRRDTVSAATDVHLSPMDMDAAEEERLGAIPSTPDLTVLQHLEEDRKQMEMKDDVKVRGVYEAIGYDKNTHKHVLNQEDQSNSRPNSRFRPDTPNTVRAYEALEAVRQLQDQLRDSEQRAQNAEQQAIQVENELIASEEKVRELAKRLKELEDPETGPPPGLPQSGPEPVAIQVVEEEPKSKQVPVVVEEPVEKKKEKEKPSVSRSSSRASSRSKKK